MRADALVPLEDEEQMALVDWLDLCGLRFSAIPMSTFTKHMSVKMKNHRLGVRPGVPDVMVLVSPERSKDGQGHLIWIEMKRRKGGVVSPEQRAWLTAFMMLESPNIHAVVAKGWDEAREAVLEHLADAPVSMF
ncbi:VRR-NUC domain-containing protein [Mycobacteroides abscessus]|uniref:VRR-NUC domain-containing protein n=1 Tax=Mycobacteroides abscessus TaxID=36809 RepID=UPI000C267BE1|nr:VRR-NUC domain-containing protein [Mycobacteroides abscessus]